jgi:molybdopterin/thiamine biosynthesis adenylyltransferase
MAEWTERAALLFKPEGLNKLQNAKVLVVGLGGVGSFAAEFLARAGVGTMTIVDGDVVDITNINRQLPALHSTVGQPKVKIVGDRLMDINP